jgi:hypothetical protein
MKGGLKTWTNGLSTTLAKENATVGLNASTSENMMEQPGTIQSSKKRANNARQGFRHKLAPLYITARTRVLPNKDFGSKVHSFSSFSLWGFSVSLVTFQQPLGLPANNRRVWGGSLEVLP